MNFKLLILRVLKILARGRPNQKFEVHPITGDLDLKAVTARVVTITFRMQTIESALTNATQGKRRGKCGKDNDKD